MRKIQRGANAPPCSPLRTPMVTILPRPWALAPGLCLLSVYLKLTDCLPPPSMRSLELAYCPSPPIICRLCMAWLRHSPGLLINRTVTLGYLPADCQTVNSLVNTADDRLLSSVVRNS